MGLQQEKFEDEKKDISERRADFFADAANRRRLWSYLQIVMIVVSALSTFFAGLAVGETDRFGFAKYVVLALTSIITAVSAYISTFRLADMPLHQLKAAQSLTDILSDFIEANRKTLTDQEYRAVEKSTRDRVMLVRRAYARLRYSPPIVEQANRSDP